MDDLPRCPASVPAVPGPWLLSLEEPGGAADGVTYLRRVCSSRAWKLGMAWSEGGRCGQGAQADGEGGEERDGNSQW